MVFSDFYIFFIDRKRLRDKLNKFEGQGPYVSASTSSCSTDARPLFKKSRPSSVLPTVTSTKPHSPSIYSVSPLQTTPVGHPGHRAGCGQPTVSPPQGMSSRRDSNCSLGKDADLEFSFPPCGESFFEDDAPLPSTLASFKTASSAKNSPVTNLTPSSRVTPDYNRTGLMQTNDSKSAGKAFSFKSPKLLLPPVPTRISTPSVGNTNQDRLSFGSCEQEGFGTSNPASGQQDFSFSYQISSAPITDSSKRFDSNLGRQGTSREGHDNSFNIDMFDSEFPEEIVDHPSTSTQYIQSAETQARSPAGNSSLSTLGKSNI